MNIMAMPRFFTVIHEISGLVPEVRVDLIRDPESMEKECSITFLDVRDVRVHWHGDQGGSKAEYLCMLLGIDDYPDDGGTEYTIATDTVEVSFKTRLSPTVEWIDPTRPFIPFHVETIEK